MIFPRTPLFVFFLLLVASLPAQEQEPYYPVAPVNFTQVEVTDAFWNTRIETNRKVTIPIAFQRSEETGRIKNFKVAGGLEEGAFNTRRGYDDSDVFKIIEGAAYSLAQHPDPQLEAYLDTLISYIGAAQEADGYLYTVKTIHGQSDAHRDARRPRWVGIEQGSHELYNVGHMYEAAVAHYEATGKRTFLNIAIKNADLIDSVFGWGKREIVPGHQEIEIGLAKLYRVTGENRYLDLAKFFLDKRGENEHQSTYNQSHKKVTEQDEAVGHSVRAAYMYTAMADMAALTGDAAYIQAMDDLWHDIVEAKLYIIGGIGAAGGHEGFGGDYELPNLRAYNETCAAIANVFWNYRLFLTHGDAKYMDVLERSLYNNVLSGVSLEGSTFFYPNRLESRGETQRSEWFSTSCCPSNVSRYLPAVPGYIYARQEDRIYVNLFISSETDFLVGGQSVRIKQNSQLPWSGKVELTIDPQRAADFSLRIRIPGWAGQRPAPSDLYAFTEAPSHPTRIQVNGEIIRYDTEKGYALIQRNWSPGDRVSIDFPYEVRRITAHPKIKTNTGRIALQAGPIVYCTEGLDYGGAANHLLMDPNQTFELAYEKDLLQGVMTINGQAVTLHERKDGGIEKQPAPFKAIPYYAWANRGAGEMLVWVPVEAQAAVPEPYPTPASQSRVETSKPTRTGRLSAVHDLYKPEPGLMAEVPAFNWWPLSDTTGSITYTFEQPTTVNAGTVYWQQSRDGGIILPRAWKMYYRKDGQWLPVEASDYPINPDGSSSTVSFESVTTDALKLEIQIGERPAGLYEWEVMGGP